MSKIDQVVDPHYRLGFVFLSYAPALVGCFLALELLHHRTSRHGTYNWFLLIASSITMGGIGIWSIYFVGTCAMNLESGHPESQATYNIGWTCASLFLPILLSAAAFYLLTAPNRMHACFIALAGLLMGAAMTSTSYVSHLSIVNYRSSYRAPHAIGASLISIAGSVFALYFNLKIKRDWTESFWKRLGCAIMLACSASATTWILRLGTRYRPKGSDRATNLWLWKYTVILCITLSSIACLVFVVAASIARFKRQQDKRRAQQLVIACTYFDESGKLMLTPKGALPTEKIIDHYIDKTFCAPELDRTHPDFLWAFRASHNWPVITKLLPAMKDHLHSPSNESAMSSDEEMSVDGSSNPRPNFSIIFKELFSVAAANLANQIHQPLEKLGTLFEEPIETGRRLYEPALLQLRVKISQNLFDLEKGSLPTFRSSGKFLFIMRQLDKESAAHCATTGFRFASLAHVSSALAQQIQIPKDELEGRLTQMRARTRREKMPAGVHLAYFELRPRLRQGFDVLVPTGMPYQLPTVKLPYDKFSPWQIQTLGRMDNWTVEQVIHSLKQKPGVGPNFEKEYHRDLLRAINLLVKKMDREAILQARLSAHLLEAPCKPGRRGSSGSCIMIAIHLMSTVYTLCPNSNFTFVPLRSFNVQQQVHTNTDQDKFWVNAQQDFVHCLTNERRQTRRSSRHSSKAALLYRNVNPAGGIHSSKGAVEQHRENADLPPSPRAGITSPEPSMEERRNDDVGSLDCQTRKYLVPSVDLSRPSRTESETFVDHMFALSTAPLTNSVFGQL